MAQKVHAVGVIFEDDLGRILLLYRKAGKPEGETWGLPAGKIEPGEDIGSTAVREVKEEIGYAINPRYLRFVKSYHWDRDDLDVFFEVFKFSVGSSEVEIRLNKGESTEYKWALPKDWYQQSDLMLGIYPILEDVYKLS